MTHKSSKNQTTEAASPPRDVKIRNSRVADAMSVADLDIPIERFLTREEEVQFAEQVRAGLARLRRLLPRSIEGQRLFMKHIARAALGSEIVVKWYPLKSRMVDDIDEVRAIHESARRLLRAPKRSTRTRKASGGRTARSPSRRTGESRGGPSATASRRAERQIDTAVERLLDYELTPEMVFSWAKRIAEHAGVSSIDRLESFEEDPLKIRERDRRLVRLITRAHERISAARDRFVLPNLRLVLKDVFRFNARGMRRSDLFQEGILGLHRAVFRFSPERKTRFSTYATFWIRQAIRKALIDRSRLIRIPQAVQEELRNPESKMSELEETRVRRIMNETASMMVDSESGSDTRDQFSFHAVDPHGVGPEDPLRSASAAYDEHIRLGVIPDAVEKALGELNVREREVVRRRFGIGESRTQTLDEVGTALQLSRERIRQIERAALEKMRGEEALRAVFEEYR